MDDLVFTVPGLVAVFGFGILTGVVVRLSRTTGGG